MYQSNLSNLSTRVLFLCDHSTMQCDFGSDGRCCWVTRSSINIICFTSGMHLQHHSVCRLWRRNSGKMLLPWDSWNNNCKYFSETLFLTHHTGSHHTNYNVDWWLFLLSCPSGFCHKYTCQYVFCCRWRRWTFLRRSPWRSWAMEAWDPSS